MPQNSGSPQPDRIGYLDGLRGVAILAVIAYHAFARWPKLVPYGADYDAVGHYGWLGVQLFFIISGFVILMTLERCRTFAEFISRRWLRLFPAMLVCSLLIYATAPILTERPAGAIAPYQLIPGLTFLDPVLLKHFGYPIKPIEGTFWSLFVEVKFYVIFGLFYFVFGRIAAIAMLACACAAQLAAKLYGHAPLHYVLHLMSAVEFAWFATGACFYQFALNRHPGWAAAALATGLLAAVSLIPLHGSASVVPGLLVVLLFAAALLLPALQRLLATRALLFVGAVSYPLYLLHENALISLTIQLGRAAPWIPPLLLPVPALAALLGIAWIVATRVELPVRAMGARALARLTSPSGKARTAPSPVSPAR